MGPEHKFRKALKSYTENKTVIIQRRNKICQQYNKICQSMMQSAMSNNCWRNMLGTLTQLGSENEMDHFYYGLKNMLFIPCQSCVLLT